MKRLFSILFLCSFMSILTLNAQKNYYFSIQAGYDLENNVSDFSLTSPNLHGYHIGAMFQYNFTQVKGLGIRTGLFFHNAYLNEKDNMNLYVHDLLINKTPQLFLDVNRSTQEIKSFGARIPIHLTYSIPLGANELILSAGPTIKYNFHSYSVDAYKFPYTEEMFNKIQYHYMETRYWNRYSTPLYLTFGSGISLNLNKFIIAVNYDWGLYNLIKKDLNPALSSERENYHLDEKHFQYRESELQISLGYRF